MHDSSDLHSRAVTYPFTGTSFSSTPSTCELSRPASRHHTPDIVTLDYDAFCAAHAGELTHSTTTMPKYTVNNVESEYDMGFPEVLSSTPNRKTEHIQEDFEFMLGMNMSSRQSMDSLTSSDSFRMYTSSPSAPIEPGSFMMTTTHNLSGSGIANSSSSWPCNDSLVALFPQLKSPLSHGLMSSEPENRPQCSIGLDNLQSAAPPCRSRLRANRLMPAHEIQRKTFELERAQIRVSGKMSKKGDGIHGVHRTMFKCDYPGCQKTFRRNAHLRRHKQSVHEEGSPCFSCEFCGKNQFNRKDNLNNHRKLHMRPNSRNRSVEFIPAAVPIIKQEERSRKRRALPRSKKMVKNHNDY